MAAGGAHGKDLISPTQHHLAVTVTAQHLLAVAVLAKVQFTSEGL